MDLGVGDAGGHREEQEVQDGREVETRRQNIMTIDWLISVMRAGGTSLSYSLLSTINSKSPCVLFCLFIFVSWQLKEKSVYTDSSLSLFSLSLNFATHLNVLIPTSCLKCSLQRFFSHTL